LALMTCMAEIFMKKGVIYTVGCGRVSSKNSAIILS
jgi:hypothetical protein